MRPIYGKIKFLKETHLNRFLLFFILKIYFNWRSHLLKSDYFHTTNMLQWFVVSLSTLASSATRL